MGLDRNKVFCPIAGRSALMRSLDALKGSGLFEGVVLVLAAGETADYGLLEAREGACDLVRAIAIGGDTRQQSVLSGLMEVPKDAGIVAIHDAARALVPQDVIRRTIESAIECGSGIAATTIGDTVKVADDEQRGVETLDRARLRAVQTPQTFRRELIVRAHELARAEGFLATDDAALVERYMGPVKLVVTPSGRRNVKLTEPSDLAVMEHMMMGNMRVGQGIDAHRLVDGRALILGGVNVPHEKGLDGHSDADVAAHALMDALLGAAGLGDIGRLFPDSDVKYKGASSIALLEEVVHKLSARGYRVVNCDVTIVAQRPKIGPYAGEMRANFARALSIDPSNVNVKATTTERMGYEGREEGISASAVALIAGVADG